MGTRPPSAPLHTAGTSCARARFPPPTNDDAVGSDGTTRARAADEVRVAAGEGPDGEDSDVPVLMMPKEGLAPGLSSRSGAGFQDRSVQRGA